MFEIESPEGIKAPLIFFAPRFRLNCECCGGEWVVHPAYFKWRDVDGRREFLWPCAFRFCQTMIPIHLGSKYLEDLIVRLPTTKL